MNALTGPLSGWPTKRLISAVLATPASIEDVVMGDLIYGAFKSVLYGTVILLVVAALGLVASPWALLVPPVLAVSGLLFGALSMIWTGLVPNIDSFNYFFSLIITPLFLFSGVFSLLKGCPLFVQQAAWISPLYHVVNLTRDLVMGRAGVHLIGDLVWWLLVATIVLCPAPVFLVRQLAIK